MILGVTDKAIAAIRQAMESENLPAESTYLRVGVKAGGCSGYSYSLGFDSQQREDDRMIEKDGVRLLLDPKSEVILNGTILDYTSGLSGQGFVFSNPNAKATCGCGSSFTV